MPRIGSKARRKRRAANDAAFIAALESGTLPTRLMNHAAHLRLALLFRGEPEKARAVLLKYVEHLGAQPKYNETLTWFWLKAVNAHEGDLPELLRTPLADKNLPMRHWSAELLWSDAARAQWVEPDLRPLPF